MQPITFIGVDVAKAEVVSAHAEDSRALQTLPNRAEPLRAWLQSLPKGSYLAVESTGRFHELIVELAIAQGHRVYLIDPRALHHYARAVHRGAKTDRLDARLIARYLAHEHARLRPYRPPSASEQALLQLQRRRAQVVRQQASLRQSLADLEGLDGEIQASLVALRRLVAAIDQRIKALLNSESERLDLAKRLATVPGFGALNCAHQATLLPRLNPPQAAALVAYAGLDPRPRDSGTFRGKRKLSKHGPGETRRLLYVAAMAAVRCAPEWRALYENLLSRGRGRVEALCILARRLLRIAYAIYRYGGVYEPARLAQTTGQAT